MSENDTAGAIQALETERLRLRRLTVDDAATLHRIHHEPGVWTYYTGTPPATAADERAQIESHLARQQHPEFGFRAVVLRQTGEMVGLCGLLSQVVDGQVEAEIAYMLSPRFWGRGLASEAARAVRDRAFQSLRCSHLISLIHPENLPSKRVALAVGMAHIKDTLFRGLPVEVYRVARPEPSKS
jgi:[ribosomal protein S5]-alanine N-acetyltransferase